MAPRSAGVIGAGVAGLAAACELARRGWEVTVYEAADRVGGVIRSEWRDGYLVEYGPNSFADPPPAAAPLVARLGLDRARRLAAESASRRYVVRRGRLVPLPASPLAALRTPILSPLAKLRLLREPFVAPRAADAGTNADDESVAAFVRRRFGREVLDYLVDPLLGGIYAGQPEHLSARHALPALHELERAHGSVVRGALRRRRAAAPDQGGELAPRPRRTIGSFDEGMETIPRRLAEALTAEGGAIRLGARATALRRDGARWRVEAEQAGGSLAAVHDAVVYAAPAYALDSLELPGAPADALRRAGAVPYAPVAVLVLGFRRDDVAHPLDGFGFLVPALERRSLLGAIFASSLFPWRAPAGHVALTVFVGGARDPRLAEADPHTLTGRILDDLHTLLGVRGEPTFRRHIFHPRAIPQYVIGHGRVQAALDELERSCPGLAFAGNYRSGIAVGEALASGMAAAARLSPGG
ncbi:MAG TPA: protoporphyrinogen oxidase [Gemmatimonadales bacterium]|nr:protoporphyrinogen oxidase [Gemmatimonadales bacterium]